MSWLPGTEEYYYYNLWREQAMSQGPEHTEVVNGTTFYHYPALVNPLPMPPDGPRRPYTERREIFTSLEPFDFSTLYNFNFEGFAVLAQNLEPPPDTGARPQPPRFTRPRTRPLPFETRKPLVAPVLITADITKYNTECPICLDEFGSDSRVLQFRCFHCMHENCYAIYKKRFCVCCPICREII